MLVDVSAVSAAEVEFLRSLKGSEEGNREEPVINNKLEYLKANTFEDTLRTV
jgi:hypothetical protein